MEEENPKSLPQRLTEELIIVAKEYSEARKSSVTCAFIDKNSENLRQAEQDLYKKLVFQHAKALEETHGDERVAYGMLSFMREEMELPDKWLLNYMKEVASKLGEIAGKTADKKESLEEELNNIQSRISDFISRVEGEAG